MIIIMRALVLMVGANCLISLADKLVCSISFLVLGR